MGDVRHCAQARAPARGHALLSRPRVDHAREPRRDDRDAHAGLHPERAGPGLLRLPDRHPLCAPERDDPHAHDDRAPLRLDARRHRPRRDRLRLAGHRAVCRERRRLVGLPADHGRDAPDRPQLHAGQPPRGPCLRLAGSPDSPAGPPMTTRAPPLRPLAGWLEGRRGATRQLWRYARIFGRSASSITGLVLVLAFLVVAAAIGVPLGVLAGYAGGALGEVIMRGTDVFLSVPALVLALAVVGALGPGIVNAMLALSLVWWPGYVRLVHGKTLALKEETFVEAAHAVGTGRLRIVFVHILPNCVSPLVVKASMDMGTAILAAAGLGFIGLGAQPPYPEWGAMISIGRNYLPTWWWYSAFPGLGIYLTVLGFNLLGDGLRDVLDRDVRALERHALVLRVELDERHTAGPDAGEKRLAVGEGVRPGMRGGVEDEALAARVADRAPERAAARRPDRVDLVAAHGVAPSRGSGAADFGDDARDQEAREEHGRARQTLELALGLPPESDTVQHDEPGARGPQEVGGADERGRVFLVVGRERDDDRVEAVGPPARLGLGHVRNRGREDAEASRPPHAAQHAEQHLLGLEERPRRGEALEGSRAEERGQGGASALELGDLRHDARRDVALGDEHGCAVREARHEDVVTRAGREGVDLGTAQPVERPGPANLDEGELRHVVVDHETLHEGDLARAVEDDGDHLPRLDELGEAPRLVPGPDAARPVGVLLDRVLELRRLLEAIEDVGGLPVRRGSAADQDGTSAQSLRPLDVAPPEGLAPGQVVLGGGEGDVEDDHGASPRV